MKKFCLFLLVGMLSVAAVEAQMTMVTLDSAANGTIASFDSTNAVGIVDNGGDGGDGRDGNYGPGDYHVTVTSTCAPYRFLLKLGELDIDCHDTLYIYDGPSVNSPIRAKINNCTGHHEGQEIYASPTNTAGVLTVRFVSVDGSQGGAGFTLSAACGTPCEKVVPVIDSAFFRVRNGVVYDTGYLRNVAVYDTTFLYSSDSIIAEIIGIDHIDTNYFVGAHLCVGDSVIFRGHGEYSYEHGYYIPSDATTHFTWDMANGGDTIQGVGLTEIKYGDYQRTGCYDMALSLVDAFGCKSNIYTSVRVRTAINPIKTIFPLPRKCTSDSAHVDMGYDGDATLTLREVESNETVSKVYQVRTFIPDGPSCPPGYFEAKVDFTEFPPSKRIVNASDVCSICINMEHSFMGDVTVSIICPSGQQAFLWYGNQDTDPREGNVPGGPGYGGSGTWLGYALDSSPYDDSDKCDSLKNPFGGGLDYCFSRNGDYTLVTGERADAIARPVRNDNTNTYITGSNFKDSFSETVGPVPSYFINGANETYSVSGTTKHPSNHEDKTDYYTPYTDFSELVGCPLNGSWKLRVHDKWGVDNGWVFNWSMDICGVTQGDDCRYTVGIDSLIFRPNPSEAYHDYDMGYYRGLQVHQNTPTDSYILSPDTAGYFPIDVYVYDEFGCVWDTNTSIWFVWSPEPNLGPDTSLCSVDQIVLDARDRHSSDTTQNYTFQWSPFGGSADTLLTKYQPTSDTRYVVEVTNRQKTTLCRTRDTINVGLRLQPIPSIMAMPFTLEGCDPLTLTFSNQSINADRHEWIFGDGNTSELASPTHTYAEGIYDLKYYAYSVDGCVDSIIAPEAIAVYTAPKAGFTWEPVYPSRLSPVVQFTNTTVPETDGTDYFWEVQYNRQNPLSVETLTEHDPSFNFLDYTDEEVAGSYAVRLIARTRNIAPSGNEVFCRDTSENTILVVNDYLLFPNVVTPNGDGINDRFVIKNLVEGLGYPVNTLDIYNKWGARVFHAENISRDEDFWDPKDMPTGTYFYRFSAKGYNGNIEHNGAVEVMK